MSPGHLFLSSFSRLNARKQTIFWAPTSPPVMRHPQPFYVGFVHGQEIDPSNRIWLITLTASSYQPQVADKISISPRLGSQLPAALPTYYRGATSIINSVSVTLKNIVMSGGADFAILEWGGDGGHTYDGVQLKRAANSTRLLTSNVDGFHSFSVHRGPHLKNCYFEHTGENGEFYESSSTWSSPP